MLIGWVRKHRNWSLPTRQPLSNAGSSQIILFLQMRWSSLQPPYFWATGSAHTQGDLILHFTTSIVVHHIYGGLAVYQSDLHIWFWTWILYLCFQLQILQKDNLSMENCITKTSVLKDAFKFAGGPMKEPQIILTVLGSLVWFWYADCRSVIVGRTLYHLM